MPRSLFQICFSRGSMSFMWEQKCLHQLEWPNPDLPLVKSLFGEKKKTTLSLHVLLKGMAQKLCKDVKKALSQSKYLTLKICAAAARVTRDTKVCFKEKKILHVFQTVSKVTCNSVTHIRGMGPRCEVSMSCQNIKHQSELQRMLLEQSFDNQCYCSEQWLTRE